MLIHVGPYSKGCGAVPKGSVAGSGDHFVFLGCLITLIMSYMADEPKTTPKIKKCPKCKGEIPRESSKCRHCGSDVRNWFGHHKIITVLLILIAFGYLVNILSGEDSATSPQVTQTATPEKTSRVFKLNESVFVGDVAWEVLSAENIGSTLKGSRSRYPFFQKDLSTVGYFIKVRFVVANTGDELLSVTVPGLIDSRDREFASSPDATYWVPEGEDILLLDNINPGLGRIYTAIYEVPADAKGLKLRVGDLEFWGSDEEVIDLGLDN